MRFLRDLPIQRKLLVMTLAICGAVLLVAVSALFLFQILSFRSSFKRDTATLAAIIAKNSTAALAFNDRVAAREIIGSLKAKPTVLCGCLVNQAGEVVAHSGALDDSNELASYPPAGEFRFAEGHLQFTQSVELEGKVIGKLFLCTAYRSVFLQLLRFYGLVTLGVAMVSVVLAVFLSERLRRVITDPVLSLADTARTVGEKNDYSVRTAVAGRGDELGLLAKAFNHMLARIQSQDAALTKSQEKLESIINSINGIVWECDPVDFRFTFVSRQSERLLGYAPAEWLANPRFWQDKLFPEDAEQAIQTCHEMVSRRQPYHYEYRMIAADHRVVWIRESGGVVVEGGQPIAVRGIFQDITEQKRAAEELVRLNRQLVDASRQAGMAEVATGVLHNVGNVLNSLNVSVTILHTELEQSKMKKLQQAVGLLRDHGSGLAAYLTTDAKGRLLPEFLDKVTVHLAGEQKRWLEELRSLRKNVEHIKEIVAMQQSYARVGGVVEVLPACGLMEDALQINAASLARRGIQVTRDYTEAPPVAVDKHKVIQILTNFIQNAKQAMENATANEKRLTLRVARNGSERVSIVVQDNGVGISKENLTRIFSHGFTTKRDGHGFGLHSGALAAKELGGSLTVHSEGPGRGATFTLEVPIAKQKR